MTSLPVHKQMRITSKRSEIDSNFINLTGLNRGRAFRIRHFYFSMTSSYSRNDDDVISGLHKKPYSKETTTGTQKVSYNTNRKSHTGFQVVSVSTLYDVTRWRCKQWRHFRFINKCENILNEVMQTDYFGILHIHFSVRPSNVRNILSSFCLINLFNVGLLIANRISYTGFHIVSVATRTMTLSF